MFKSFKKYFSSGAVSQRRIMTDNHRITINQYLKSSDTRRYLVNICAYKGAHFIAQSRAFSDVSKLDAF